MNSLDKINEQELKIDFYKAVNGEWEKKAVIPNDHASTGGFMDLVDNIEKTLMKDFADLKAGQIKPENSEMVEFKKYYDLATDFDKKEADGVKPLLSILKRVESIKSFADLNEEFGDWTLSGLPTPIDFGVEADMKQAEMNVLYVDGGPLFLPDRSYYDKDNQQGVMLMNVFKNMSVKLLKMVGYNDAQANNIWQAAERFDRSIAPYVLTAEQKADIENIYNPMNFDDIADKSNVIDLKHAIKSLIGQVPDEAIVTEPKFLDNLDKIVNDDTFNDMKNWMLVRTVNSFSNSLNEEYRQTSGEFSRALSGRKEAQSKEKAAYNFAANVFSQVVGDYYGKKYFGEKAKQDVYNMVVKMIGVYEKRLQNNDWLSESTKEKAIIKLKALGIHVGYPDKINPLFSKFKVTTKEDGGTLFENTEKINRLIAEDNMNKWHKPVDRSLWGMSANMVNAYYSPTENQIVFPAAILQAPFYSLKQSSSENFGGIGAVMAHEISHAFDNNGSNFDEHGNLANWWTKEDHEYFGKLAENMIKEFDGIEFAGQKVNGKLTVSENIADAGGLSCAEEAAKGEDDCNLREFFINWARIWRNKSTEQIKQLLLSIDVHAPSELRATVQVKNLDDFYTTFNVTEKDKMYLKPADRVQIW
ncbi:Neutral endopeptidase [Apilactobacillus ozensis DSM 23829 = JCM 17196]|uniref:Neutral endopeptidase n=1 Tax=Apilactobacillus ozensis DSM 23829 = JCM 17196 TaxID=1423781 RepID=A0A0R2ATG4_9LACO|nr:M13 family metallopeptidase [Apilactobacillus ozensis]KRM69882.1 Neutral endopeptidase [Apilactobacillus ozensis DSM 23829 = JCM 17196]